MQVTAVNTTYCVLKFCALFSSPHFKLFYVKVLGPVDPSSIALDHNIFSSGINFGSLSQNTDKVVLVKWTPGQK